MVEVMVVVVILVIMASLAIPKFANNDKRKFKLLLEQVSDLMTMFAQREMLEQRPIGIMYDADNHWLLLVGLDTDPSDGMPADWIVDPHVQPVKFPEDAWISEVVADGDFVDIVEWPLATSPEQARPSITITIASEQFSGTIMLPTHAILPELSGFDRVAVNPYESVDLDSAGRSREEW